MKPGTQADLKRHLESECGIIVTRQAISLLVKDNDYRIQKTPGGKIKIEETAKLLSDSGFGKRAELIARKNGKAKPGKAEPNIVPKMSFLEMQKREEERSVKLPPTPEEHEQDIEAEGPLKVTDSRERIEKHKAFQQAEKERIANEKSMKKLIDINLLSDRVFNFVKQFAEHQQNQKDRIGSKIEAAETRHEIERILEDDNHHGLKSIADSFDLDENTVKKKILQHLIR